MTCFTVLADEFVTDDFWLPSRRIVAELEMLSGTPPGAGTLRLVIERRENANEPYRVIARTRVLAGIGKATVIVPTPDADPPVGTRPPLARCRLIRAGHLERRRPRFEINLLGL